MINKKIPLRKCVGCMEMKEKKNLIRVVKTPEETFVLDDTGKKNGRGAYICKNRECLQKAVKNHGLERSFQTAISREVYDALSTELEKIEQS